MTNYNKPVKDEEIKMENDSEVGEKKVIVNVSKLNVRKAPSLKASVLAVVNEGDELTLQGNMDKTWTKISTEDIPNGFVMTEFIKEV